MLLHLSVFFVYGLGLVPSYAAYRDVGSDSNFVGVILWICVALTIFVIATSLAAFIPLLAEIIHNPRLTSTKKLELCRETFEPLLDIFDHLLAFIFSILRLPNPASRRHSHVNSKKKAKNGKN